MNKDIRISVDFFEHHKTKRLKRRLGWEGVIALQQLWCYAAKHRPEGSLSGMDSEDIADVCDWEGDPEEFVSKLCEIGFIDQCDEGMYHLHDWEENNPWAANARERSEKARKAALAKHQKKTECDEHADGMPNACDEHATSTSEQGTRTAERHAPSPSPSPSPPPEGSTEYREENGPSGPGPYPNEKNPADPYVCAIPTQAEGKPLKILKSQADKWQQQFQYIDVYGELGGLEEWAENNPEKRWKKGNCFMACVSRLTKTNREAMIQCHKNDPHFDPNDPDGSKASRADWEATQAMINRTAANRSVGGTA